MIVCMLSNSTEDLKKLGVSNKVLKKSKIDFNEWKIISSFKLTKFHGKNLQISKISPKLLKLKMTIKYPFLCILDLNLF